MNDDQCIQLLELLARYQEAYGPDGEGGPPPSDLLLSELAGDLRTSLPRVVLPAESALALRLDRLGLR